jgi:large subunit ribosomal protein L17
MRHRVAYRKLGRVTAHRIALLRNQATALLRHERIETTVPKAKELRPFVERLITIAKRGLAAEGGANGRALSARRLVLRDIADRSVVSKLFDTIAPRFAERPGGYTRLLRIGYRRGDSAEVAQVELVGSEYNPNVQPEKTEAEKAKKPGVGGRLRAAAEKLRGKKAAAGEDQAAESKAKAKQPKGARAKSTAPRKQGGNRKSG